MKNYIIYFVLIIFGGIITYIMLKDAFATETVQENPYAYELGDFRKVDPLMVKYREVKRINTSFPKPKAIDYKDGLLGIAYESYLQVIDTLGREYFNSKIDVQITSIAFAPDRKIFLGCMDHIAVYDLNGYLIDTWEIIDSASYITSMAFKGNDVFIADSGGPLVYKYSKEGVRLGSFDGTGRVQVDYGFIIPSPYFDVAIDLDDQLWVANTGLQSIENYSDEGALRAYWGEPSFGLKGFIGCCNPVHFSILSNGSFVTSEKGLIRIKVYHPSGELDCVVASPDDFDKDSEPVDLAIDEYDGIYLLDATRKMIRKFERKS